jgi:hypothetical protein
MYSKTLKQITAARQQQWICQYDNPRAGQAIGITESSLDPRTKFVSALAYLIVKAGGCQEMPVALRYPMPLILTMGFSVTQPQAFSLF